MTRTQVLREIRRTRFEEGAPVSRAFAERPRFPRAPVQTS